MTSPVERSGGSGTTLRSGQARRMSPSTCMDSGAASISSRPPAPESKAPGSSSLCAEVRPAGRVAPLQLAYRPRPLDAPLMISVAGVRGIVGDSLTPPVLARFAAAFAAEMPAGEFVVGRDARRSG